MIAQLTGTIAITESDSVIIQAGGVGYRVYVSSDTHRVLVREKNNEVTLWTHLAVRENAMDLYGFSARSELDFFELLIDVPGIGPKSALAILSLATTETLQQSIVSGDTTYLTKVAGIGKKTAEKIVLELKDKLGGLEGDGPDLKNETDAVSALRSLGYSLAEARDAVKAVPQNITGTSERVREALKLLGKNAPHA